MFSKIVVASAIATTSALKASVSHGQASEQKTSKVTSTVSSASVDTSAAITVGGWSRVTEGDCANPESEPSVVGYTLGECVTTSASTATKYTGCEFSSDRTSFYTYTSTFATSDCTDGGTASTTTYSGLTDGCDGVSPDWKYYCGADINVEKYDSPQHTGYFDNNACSGTEYRWDIYYYGSCTDDSSCYSYTTYESTKGICDDPDDICFHVDTKIDYKGVEYTYAELKAGKEPECTVPHSPSSKGVVISTSCDKTVRVTDTHLMATTKGFQLAYSLKAGDVLYGDYGKDMCTVKSVEKEKTTQQYFGLNCVHSEVLASGLRASTFGDFHTLPSWYMTYVGGLVGSETASSIGEYIAEWYFQK